MRLRSPRRRRSAASLLVLALGLLLTGGLYAAVAPTDTATAAARTAQVEDDIELGRKLFEGNCASCHGLNLEGGSDAPSLIGVGAASVDFQVGTGRMPAKRTQWPQVPKSAVLFTELETAAMAAYVASVSNGPGIPAPEQYLVDDLTPEEIAEGGELYRTNCAMCHNAVGSGGALTAGKWAPALRGIDGKYIYEAMLTGPQQMPVFADTVPEEDKLKIIGYLKNLDGDVETEGFDGALSYGGFSLGALGPVTEGAFVWIVGMGALIGIAVWLGARSK